MSRTRTLSLALLAILLSRSLRSLSSSDKASSVLLGSQHHRVSQGGAPGGGRRCRAGSAPAVRWKRPKRPSFCKANCCGCCWGGPGCGGCLSPLQLWEVLPARGGGCGCSGDSCTPCTTLTAVLSAKVGGCWARLGPKTLGLSPKMTPKPLFVHLQPSIPTKGLYPNPLMSAGSARVGAKHPTVTFKCTEPGSSHRAQTHSSLERAIFSSRQGWEPGRAPAAGSTAGCPEQHRAGSTVPHGIAAALRPPLCCTDDLLPQSKNSHRNAPI